MRIALTVGIFAAFVVALAAAVALAAPKVAMLSFIGMWAAVGYGWVSEI